MRPVSIINQRWVLLAPVFGHTLLFWSWSEPVAGRLPSSMTCWCHTRKCGKTGETEFYQWKHWAKFNYVVITKTYINKNFILKTMALMIDCGYWLKSNFCFVSMWIISCPLKPCKTHLDVFHNWDATQHASLCNWNRTDSLTWIGVLQASHLKDLKLNRFEKPVPGPGCSLSAVFFSSFEHFHRAIFVCW